MKIRLMMFVCLFIEPSTCMSEDQPATNEGKFITCYIYLLYILTVFVECRLNFDM